MFKKFILLGLVILLSGCFGSLFDKVSNMCSNNTCNNPPPTSLVQEVQIYTGNFNINPVAIKINDSIDFKARVRYDDKHWYDATDKVDWTALSNNPAYIWDNSVNGRLIGIHQGRLLPIQVKFESKLSNQVIVNIRD